MYRYAQCPACLSKLKFQGNRSSLVCPKCKTRIALTSELHPLANPSLAKKSLTQLPTHTTATANRSQGLVIGIAAGTVFASLVVAGFLLIPRGDTTLAPLPEPSEESSLATVTEPAVMPATPAVKQPSDEPSRTTEEDPPKEVADTQLLANANDQTSKAAKANEKPNRSTPQQQPTPGPRSPDEPSLVSTDSAQVSWKYRWQNGRSYHYTFQLIRNLGSGDQRLKGTCNYRVGRVVRKISEEELTTTGTGFVVSEDGYLVTCAHVVQDAARIKVTLGKQQWEGKVVAIDPVQDLAVLRVEAQNLPALLLSNAHDVELAASVRVVGFPLATMLGKGIKITSGTVAGRTEEDESGARSFQVDASVNPGNSGGPIVDQNGHVIGVASALLSGQRISEVGFAVPAGQVHRLLKQANISPSATTKPKPKNGPDLARMVTPSVAYLEVLVDPKTKQSRWIDFDFTYQAVAVPRASLTPSAALVRGQLHQDLFPTRANGKFAVTQFGQLSRFEGEERLPPILGTLAALAIENLEHNGKKSWSSTTFTELQVQQQDRMSQLFGRFGHPHTMLSQNEPKKTSYPAIKHLSYQVTDETAEQVTFTKNYEYRTLDENDPPLYRQKGSGTVVFDKKIGMPISLEFESTVNFRNGKDESVTTVPYTLSYHLRSADEITKEKALAAATSKSTKKSAAGNSNRKSPRKPTTYRPKKSYDPQRVEELIALLNPKKNKPDDQEQFAPDISDLPPQAAEFVRQHLRRTTPLPSHDNELRELVSLDIVAKQQYRVGNIFLHFARHGNSFDQSTAIQGLAKWGSKKHVPGMIYLLTKEIPGIDWPERQNLINSLSQFKSPTVCRAIASRLMHFPENRDAKEALIKIGADAEKSVCEILDHKSQEARNSAAEILEEIGTRKSLALLQKAFVEEPDHFTKNQIQDAITAIRNR